MKQLFILLLAALLLTSCGGTSDAPTTDTAGNSIEEVPAESEVETSPFHIQPESNGGKTMTTLVGSYHEYEFLAPDITGELINDSVHDRNMAVEELLDIKLEFISLPCLAADAATFWNTVSGSIMAGDKEYDMISVVCSSMQPYATPEYYLDLTTLEDLHLDNPWWVTGMQEDLSIQGKLLNIIGDMNLSMYKQFPVVFANTTMLSDQDIDVDMLYSEVKDGSWTFETLFSYAKYWEQDLDGNGTIETATDRIGLSIQSTPFWAVQAAFDTPIITLDEKGIPYYVGMTEKFHTTAEWLSSVINGNAYAAISLVKDGVVEQMTDIYLEERTAFLLTTMTEVEKMRDMESDFTILPFPKLEETDPYRTLIATATNMNYVPVNVEDPVLVGKLMESLAYYSYESVVPAYYETTLKDRYSRDENTQIMLDIIREGAVLPFEFAYATALEWPNNVMAEAIKENKVGQLASDIQANSSKWEAAIEKVMGNYGEDS